MDESIARRARGAIFAALAAGAVAGPAWAPASAQGVPSYATGESISGTIAAITGKYTLSLDDVRGFEDSVTLRDGTAITPTGISLEVGQQVTITGHADGATFDADEIDTDGSDTYASGAGDAAYAYGSADSASAYPPYVVPLGGGAYYYGYPPGACCFAGYGNSGYYYITTNGGPPAGHAPAPGPPHGAPVPRPPGHYRPPVSYPRTSAARSAPARSTSSRH